MRNSPNSNRRIAAEKVLDAVRQPSSTLRVPRELISVNLAKQSFNTFSRLRNRERMLRTLKLVPIHQRWLDELSLEGKTFTTIEIAKEMLGKLKHILQSDGCALQCTTCQKPGYLSPLEHVPGRPEYTFRHFGSSIRHGGTVLIPKLIVVPEKV